MAMSARFKARWLMFAFLFAFGVLAYIQRTSIAVAAERMMPELGLTQLQIGWLLTAFLVSYTACQVPAGLFGARLGARRIFPVMVLGAFAATVLTPLAALLMSGTALFVMLLFLRTLLGVAQAPTRPVSSGVIEAWFPAGKWALPQGLQVAGLCLGSAITPPLIAWLMQTFGWKAALWWSSLPALPLIAWWWWYARDTPQEHRSVSSAELHELAAASASSSASSARRVSWKEVGVVLRDRNILLLACSYACMSYVFYLLTFWSFLYLVQERRFTVLESGGLATFPFLAAAAGAALGGGLTDRLCAQWGIRWGFRAVPLLGLPLSGLLLLLSVKTSNPYWAVAGLSLAFAAIELAEGAYFAAAISVARSRTMAAIGVVNCGGGIGGIIGTPLVASLSSNHRWTTAFATGAALAVISGLLWFRIDASRRLATLEPAPLVLA